MNQEKILEIIQLYFPSDLYHEDERYQNSEEYKRLRAAINDSEIDHIWWDSFKSSLENKFKEYKIEDCTQLFNLDRCFRVRIWLNSKEAIMVHVSILGQYSAIYLSVKDEEFSIPKIEFENFATYSDIVDFIDDELKEKYGILRLDHKLLSTPVSNVAIGNSILGESTIFDCLFTDHIF